jgi:magnesium-protoporphyrin IX monomethyl ester (oxidative) cyclase
VPKAYLTEVFPHLHPPENTNIFYEVKTNLNEQQIEVLAKAHVNAIQPGIESLSTKTLQLMRKGTTASQNIIFLKNCLVYGIKPDWNLLVGFPGEDEEVYEHYDQVLPLLTHLQPPTGVYPIRFDRFSPYFNAAEEYDLELKPYDFYSMVYPFAEEDIKDLAYFFIDHHYNAPHMKLSAKWIKKLESHVDVWHRRWHQRDGKLKPSLVFEWRGETRIVSDSRSGEVMEHEIDEPGLRILDLLASPLTLLKLKEDLPDLSDNELVEHLSKLQSINLLFQERNSYISLVVDTGMDSGYL